MFPELCPHPPSFGSGKRHFPFLPRPHPVKGSERKRWKYGREQFNSTFWKFSKKNQGLAWIEVWADTQNCCVLYELVNSPPLLLESYHSSLVLFEGVCPPLVISDPSSVSFAPSGLYPPCFGSEVFITCLQVPESFIASIAREASLCLSS